MYSERDITIDEAILCAKRLINREQLHAKVKELPVKGVKLATYRVFLDGPKNSLRVGNGKGRTKKESLASALFESLEHHYYSLQDNSEVKYIEFEKLKKQDEHIEGEYWFQYLKRKEFNGEVATYPYNKLSSDGKKIRYPAFLTNVYFNEKKDVMGQYSYLNYYSSNNGCASGTSLVETLIHSLSEVIERDSVSEFIMRDLMGNHVAEEIDPHSLPPKIQELVKNVESEVGSIHILDITEKGLMPSFLVFTYNNKKSRFPMIGCGSSLNSDYALSRAITECLQTYQLADFDAKHDNIIKNNFQQLPQLYDLVSFKTLSTNMVDYDESKSISYKTNNKGKLKEIINLLEQNNYSAYYRVIFKSKGLYVTQVIVPGFDSFNLLLDGQPVMPNKRTKSLLKK